MKHPIPLLLVFLGLFAFAACDDEPANEPAQDQAISGDAADAGDIETDLGPDAALIPDAGLGHRPDELPFDGPMDLPGADTLTEVLAAGEVRAGRVDIDEERLTGPEANCRVGDFRMDNAVISLCIQAETTFSNFSFFGGNIIDAHLADRPGTDSLREVVIAPSVGEVTVERIGIVRDGTDGIAAVRTVGRAQGALIIQGVLPNAFVPPDFLVTTEYRLSPDSNIIDVWTWIHADKGEGGIVNLLDFVYFGDRNRDFKPGFTPETVGEPMTYVAAEGRDVSYSWSAGGDPFTLFLLATVGVPGAPVQYEPVAFSPDDMHLFKRTLTVGKDVETIRQRPEGAIEVTVTGVADSRVDIDTPEGNAVTRIKLDDLGRGTVNLIPGDYLARTHGYSAGDIELPFTAVDEAVVALEQPEPATLVIRATDSNGVPLAIRVDLSGPANRRVFVVDEKTVQLPAGEWSVVGTRGWHYDVAEQAVTLAAGQEQTIDIELTEVIPLEGWASGEFHQHASPSLDSEVPVEERVLSNLVEGVDFMVPSDHDIIYDYGSLIERMGLSDRIAAPLTGEEVSPLFTHMGAYGMPYDAYAGAGGAVRLPVLDGQDWRAKTVPELIEEIRDRGVQAIQINHPRASQGYFDHVGYEPHVPLDSLDHEAFSSDFDSLEVFNSAGDFCRVLADWLGLLNQGLRVTAVGNSDTHSLSSPVGYPRNYLPTLSPDRVGVTADEIVTALRQGTMTVGGGAMMDFPDGPQPGETLTVDEDTLSIRVRVRTPSHLSVTRLIGFVNATPVIDQVINSAVEDITDIDAVLEIPNTADAHLVFLALGEERLQYIRPGQPVFALSNPIWLDRDGGGVTPTGPAPIDLLELPFCD